MDGDDTLKIYRKRMKDASFDNNTINTFIATIRKLNGKFIIFLSLKLSLDGKYIRTFKHVKIMTFCLENHRNLTFQLQPLSYLFD